MNTKGNNIAQVLNLELEVLANSLKNVIWQRNTLKMSSQTNKLNPFSLLPDLN